jgi:tRNA pseudouridine(38-40) synthase
LVESTTIVSIGVVHIVACSNTTFEESYQDEQLRLFWQAEPFSIVEALMDKIMAMNPDNPVKLLEKLLLQNSSIHHHADVDNKSSRGPVKKNTKKSSNVFQNFYDGRIIDENDVDYNNDCAADCTTPLFTGRTSLPTERSGKHNFRLDLAYKGSDFCGWQRQCKKSVPKNMSMTTADTAPTPSTTTTNVHDNRNNDSRSVQSLPTRFPSVQEIVEAALDDRDVRVAGRTDSGVHAFGQVARVRLETHISLQHVQQQLTTACLSSQFAWKCWRVVPVDTKFHPAFGAKSRSYVYVLDGQVVQSFFGNNLYQTAKDLNTMLQPLEGEALDYYAFSYGQLKTQSSICTLYHARVSVAKILAQHEMNNDSANASGSSTSRNTALIVELTGDRFLRRMVRKLVATALRLLVLLHIPIQSSEGEIKTNCLPNNTESIADGINLGEALLKIVQSKDRRDTAKAAPPNGLIIVGAEMKKNHS